ncbi:MAG: hypothetical protein ACREKL_02345 [Chthoniobacterales bacterium]
MFSPRSAPLVLTCWLCATTAALAQAAPAAEARPAWATLADGAPVLWGCVWIAVIVTAALLGHLVFVLRRSRVSPPALIETLGNAVGSGNYQEAWDTCHRHGQTSLGRMLQPALERIGQGRPAVETRLAEEELRERRHLGHLLGALPGVALVAVVICIVGAMAQLSGVGGAAMSADGPRAAALAWGNAAMFAALAVAVIVPVAVAWPWLRARADVLLREAGAQGLQLVADLPYEDIEGVRIGRDFHAGTLLGGETGLAQTGRLQVSKELTTQCPTCNGPINSSRNSCPHCGQLLSWS